MDVGVNKTGSDVGSVDIDYFYFGRKFFLLKPLFAVNVGDFVVFNVNRTILHNRKSGQDIGVVQADCCIHNYPTSLRFADGGIIGEKGKIMVKLFLLRRKIECEGVDTVALTGCRGAVGKNVSEMRAAV